MPRRQHRSRLRQVCQAFVVRRRCLAQNQTSRLKQLQHTLLTSLQTLKINVQNKKRRPQTPLKFHFTRNPKQQRHLPLNLLKSLLAFSHLLVHSNKHRIPLLSSLEKLRISDNSNIPQHKKIPMTNK